MEREDYASTVARSFGLLLGFTEASCAQLLTTTDLAEVYAIAERLRKFVKECDEATTLPEKE